MLKKCSTSFIYLFKQHRENNRMIEMSLCIIYVYIVGRERGERWWW
jgi:hypothetical protein